MKNIGKTLLAGLLLASLLSSCATTHHSQQKKKRKRAPCDCPTFGHKTPVNAYYVQIA
jgi:hypothetical protein